MFSILLATSIGFASPMTLDDLAATRSVTGAWVSPDGKTLAYARSVPRTPYSEEDGHPHRELHVIRDGLSRPYITGKQSFSGGQFSADGETFYFLDKRGDDEHTALYALPVHGGEATQVCGLDEQAISAFDLSPDGKTVALLARDVAPEFLSTQADKGFRATIYEENLRHTRVHITTLGDCTAAPLAIDGHLEQVAFAPTGDRLLLAVTPTPLIDDIYMETRLRITDLTGKTLTAFDHPGKLGASVWSPDGKHVAWIGVVDRNDPRAGRLRIGDAATGEISRYLDETEGHVMSLSWSKTGLLTIVHLGTASELWSIDPRNGRSKVLVSGRPEILRRVVSHGRQTALLADAPTHPTELFTLRGSDLVRQTDSNPWLSERTLGEQSAISWTADDGLRIEGILIKPTNYESGTPVPLIVYVHGGPESHDSNGWLQRYSWPVHVAAGKGYAALIPNYRGSTGRGVAYSKRDQHGYAKPEFDDIVAGKDWLVSEGIVNADRVGITGGSYGGYATAWSSTALSEHYAAGVMFVGISNQLSKFGTTDIPKEMYDVHARAWPWDDWQWFLDRSPIYHAEKSKTPLLILHGEEDTRVHPSQSIEMYRYLKLRGQAPVRLVLYPGEGHGNRRAGSQYDYSVRMLRWMDHYLMGEGGQPPASAIDWTERFAPEVSETETP